MGDVVTLYNSSSTTRNLAVADKPRDAFVQYGVADPSLKHAPPHVCYLAARGRFASTGVGINRGVLEPRPLWCWRGWPTRNITLPHTVPHVLPITIPNLVVLGQTVRALLRRSAWKNLAPCLSRSFKVIGTDMDRAATHDFLLTCHSNRHFPDKRQFQLKIANFSCLRVYNASAEGVPVGIA